MSENFPIVDSEYWRQQAEVNLHFRRALLMAYEDFFQDHWEEVPSAEAAKLGSEMGKEYPSLKYYEFCAVEMSNQDQSFFIEKAKQIYLQAHQN